MVFSEGKSWKDCFLEYYCLSPINTARIPRVFQASTLCRFFFLRTVMNEFTSMIKLLVSFIASLFTSMMEIVHQLFCALPLKHEFGLVSLKTRRIADRRLVIDDSLGFFFTSSSFCFQQKMVSAGLRTLLLVCAVTLAATREVTVRRVRGNCRNCVFQSAASTSQAARPSQARSVGESSRLPSHFHVPHSISIRTAERDARTGPAVAGRPNSPLHSLLTVNETEMEFRHCLQMAFVAVKTGLLPSFYLDRLHG